MLRLPVFPFRLVNQSRFDRGVDIPRHGVLHLFVDVRDGAECSADQSEGFGYLPGHSHVERGGRNRAGYVHGQAPAVPRLSRLVAMTWRD